MFMKHDSDCKICILGMEMSFDIWDYTLCCFSLAIGLVLSPGKHVVE